MTSSNVEYFERRSREERSAAEVTADPAIAAVHREMAELYENAAQVSGRPPQTPIHLFGDPAGA